MSPDELAVEVRRRLAARPEQVFGAFADAGLVSRWLKPAPEVGLTVLELDSRRRTTQVLALTSKGSVGAVRAPRVHALTSNGSVSAVRTPRAALRGCASDDRGQVRGHEEEVDRAKWLGLWHRCRTIC